MTAELQKIPEPMLLAEQNDRLQMLVAELIRKNEELRQRLAVAEAAKAQGWA